MSDFERGMTKRKVFEELLKGSFQDFITKFRKLPNNIPNGYMTILKLCKDRRTGDKYVAKCMNPKIKRVVENINYEKELISKQLRILKRIGKSENILGISALYELKPKRYIVLSPYTKYGDFVDFRNNHQPSYFILKNLYFQLALALNFIHSKDIIHRDIKPENCLIFSKSGESGESGISFVLKLIDFEYSHTVDDEKSAKHLCGTTSYISPELLTEDIYATKDCDMWAMGVLIYNITSGLMAFSKQDKEKTNEGLKSRIMSVKYNKSPSIIPDDDTRDLIDKLIVFNPNKRFTARMVLFHPLFYDISKVNHLSHQSSLLFQQQNSIL